MRGQVGHQQRRRAPAVGRGDPRQRGERWAAGEGLEHARSDRLTLAAHHAVDRPVGVRQQLPGDEGCAVAAHQHPAVGQDVLRLAREVDDLGDVGQVVEGEADHLGPPGAERPAIVAMPEDLEVEQPDLVPRRRERRPDPLDPEGLEPEVDLGEEERARVHEKDTHGTLLAARSGGEFELLLRSRRAEQDELTVDPGGRTTLVGGSAAVLGGGLVASMTRNALVLLLVLALAAGHIHQLATGQGQADPHMGDQAELFRTFAYKPMVLR